MSLLPEDPVPSGFLKGRALVSQIAGSPKEQGHPNIPYCLSNPHSTRDNKKKGRIADNAVVE